MVREVKSQCAEKDLVFLKVTPSPTQQSTHNSEKNQDRIVTYIEHLKYDSFHILREMLSFNRTISVYPVMYLN